MTRNLRMVTTVILVLAIAFICCARGEKQGNPIRLPDRNEVVSIGVSDGEKLAFSPNTEGEADAFIDEFYSILLDMEVTSKESINDVPVNKDSITIHINCLDNSGTTLFYYRDKGTEYVEQPYQGIYKPTPALGICITEMLNSSNSTPATATFQATVTEVFQKTLDAPPSTVCVKPVADSLELNSSDVFNIPNKEQLELQVGNLVEITYNGEIMETYPAQLGEVYKITLLESAEADAMYDIIPMVKVKGKLYYDTGKGHDGGKCGIMDGEITSSVDGSEIPTEDDQSNFGSGKAGLTFRLSAEST